MNGFLKKNWFVCLLALLFAGVSVFYIYDTNHGKLKGKTVNGEDVLYEINSQDVTAANLYDSLYKTYGSSAVASLIDKTVAAEAIETTDEMKTNAAAQAASIIASYQSNYPADYKEQLEKVLIQMGYNGYDDLQQYLIDRQQEESDLPEDVRETVADRSRSRLREMTFYATGEGCLRARILRYFGEEAGPCGHCGGCLQRKSAPVKGERTAPATRLDGTPVSTRGLSGGLFMRLSDARKRIAREQKVPPFVIFTNATLRDMAVKRPRTRQEMLRVMGVGENKMARYGETFLAVIAAWEEEHR